VNRPRSACWLAAALVCGTFGVALFSKETVFALVLLAMALIAGITGAMRAFPCTYCGRSVQTWVFSQKMKCPRCEHLHIIDWKHSS
jgi:hypothetical protein